MRRDSLFMGSIVILLVLCIIILCIAVIQEPRSLNNVLPDDDNNLNLDNTAVYAITDVMVSDSDSSVPADYTGVTHLNVTSPYIPGIVGSRLTGDDVNAGIGGTTTRIWVKYSKVDPRSNTMVLTGITPVHWVDWNGVGPAPESYALPNANSISPTGWKRANGTSAGIPGALTTKTKGSCWRMGLCVQYKPISEVYATREFIPNLYLSITGSSEPANPAFTYANGETWLMYPNFADIHTGAGGNFYYLCYSKGCVDSPYGPPKAVTPELQYECLKKYAPRVWLSNLDEGDTRMETYLPSSVEWAFPHLERFNNSGNYWLRTKEPLSSPSSVLNFFHGNSNLSADPVYSYWVQKNDGYVDLVYFFYYPYNRGKNIESIFTVMGNHVSDWEHITIRCAWNLKGDKWELVPYKVFIQAHDFGNTYYWMYQNKVNDTHVVVYGAWGSHGLYIDPGSHKYKSIPLIADLCDDCGPGLAWDTWNNVSAMDYNNRTGLGGYHWPSWMDTDFSNPGIGNPSDPASGPIFRWGNPKRGFETGGESQLNDGPTGPPSKTDVWDPKKLA